MTVDIVDKGNAEDSGTASVRCLYYFTARSIINDDDTLIVRLQKGIDRGFAYYKDKYNYVSELSYYGRLANLYEFVNTQSDKIRSSGYVVDSLEAAIWCLIKTTTLRDALLTAVNLGDDTDTRILSRST